MSAEVFSWNEISRKTRIRWFLQRGAITDYERGWRSLADVDRWIESLGNRLDWRVGYTLRLKGDTIDMFVVKRNGQIARR